MPAPLTHDDPVELGTYRLLARLGSGGMGTVYLARSPGGRTVALKTMHARIAAEASFRTRFRLEADAARVIGGQYGAQVVDADPLAETPWLATEYVIGPPLDEAVDLAGPLPEASVRALGAGLCVALRQLHRSDVVHRDLKPSNIMVTAYGPKIIDFGIARALGDRRLTHTGAAVGTPAFMSPEQAGGQEHTPAGDVFALAGVLVFASTGTGPFGFGQAADLLYRVRYEKPDLTRVPPSLAPLLARCLEKDPARRPTTPELATRLHDGSGDFADHLPEPVLDDIARRAAGVWQPLPGRLPAPEGVDVPEGGTEEDGRPGPSRRRLLFLGAGAGVAVAAAGAGVWAWRDTKPDGEVPETGARGRPVEQKPTWSTESNTDDLQDYPPAPYMVGDSVLVTGDPAKRFDAKTGHRLWETGTLHFGQTAVDGTSVYTLIDFKDRQREEPQEAPWPLQIGTLDLSSGKPRSPFVRFDDINGAVKQSQLLCAAHGVLYLVVSRGPYAEGNLDRKQKWFLKAFDVATKKMLWSKPLPPVTLGEELDDSGFRFRAGQVVGDHLVVLANEVVGPARDLRNVTRVVVLDVHTGTTRWEKSLDLESQPVPLSVDDGCVYVGGARLRALRLSDGREMWAVRTLRSGGAFGSPSVADRVVYAVEKNTGLVAVGARSGRRLWAEDTDDAAKADLVRPPAAATTYVYYKNGADIRAVSLSTHRPALTYAVNVDRFVLDTRQRMLIAVGLRATYGIAVQ